MGLDIVYITDDNFAKILGISILSILESNKDLNICIHIIDMGIDNNNKYKIEDQIKEYHNVNILFYKIDEIVHRLKEMKLNVPVENNSVATLGRLYLGDILPLSVKKVLYLDCDILINGSLQNIAEFEFDTSIAAVKDFNYKFARSHLDMVSPDKYFNAGVMLINLDKFGKKIRKNNLEDLLSKNYAFADQDILNIVFKDDCCYLSPIYNSSTRIRMLEIDNLLYIIDENEKLYNLNEIKKAKENPILIHFTSSLLGRPWEENCIDPDKIKWKNLYKKSLWSEMKLDNRILSFSNKIGRIIYKFFPQKIYCVIDKSFAERKYKKENEK